MIKNLSIKTLFLSQVEDSLLISHNIINILTIYDK